MHGTAKPGGLNRIYRCSQSPASLGPDRCSCRRVSASAVENSVWDLLVCELSDPDRLTKLSGLAEADSPPTDIADIAAIDRKIRRLENALATQIAQLLAAGVDAAAVNQAAAQLEADLQVLRDQRSIAIRWAAARSDRNQAIERTRRFAESARQTLLNPTTRLKQQVVELLDIVVQITGFRTCPECEGRRLVPSGETTRTQARGHTGKICPT